MSGNTDSIVNDRIGVKVMPKVDSAECDGQSTLQGFDFNAIQAELDAAKKRFNMQDSQKGNKFKLD